ncbi:MAG: hypothetical protein J7L53_06730 [Deltaproteobacteria bacterium]|nr:hypothetical protein [Deltaproteobacteria bacterium]
MKKLGVKRRLWLKGFHVFFSCTWIGAIVSMMIVLFLKGNPISGGELYGYHASIKIIDDFIVIPSALGCLITGLLLSWKTNWGFFKYRWIIVKLVVTVSAIVFGTLYLGPWGNALAAISKAEGLLALQNEQYIHSQQMNILFGTIQVIALITMVFISTLKPWGRRK